MICAKSGQNWARDSGEKNLNDPIPFLHFCDYLPFEDELALYLNRLEFPLPKDNLYQV
jgi:hypothetical protein